MEGVQISMTSNNTLEKQDFRPPSTSLSPNLKNQFNRRQVREVILTHSATSESLDNVKEGFYFAIFAKGWLQEAIQFEKINEIAKRWQLRCPLGCIVTILMVENR